jgi:hypothetical protein
MTEPELVANADSKGLILDFFQLTTVPTVDGVLGRSPRTDPKVSLNLVRNDPVVRAAVIKLVDKVVESGWRIQPIDGNKKASTKELELKLKAVRFDRLLRKIVFNLIMYNNAFLEIRMKGGELSDLNLLEAEFMKIDADDHGNISGYYQQVGDPKITSYPRWNTEEVVHLKLDDFTTNLWSEFNIEAIYETVVIKDYVRQWFSWLFGTNQFRPVLAVEDTNSTKMKEFLAFIHASSKDIKKPIPVEGKLTVTALQDPAIIQWGLAVWDKCNQEIRQLLQVPDIAVGISDNGGRADGAEQREYLNTRVFNIHRLLEDDITFDLFPKIGFGKNEFIFGILDETVRTRVFDNVLTMRNSNFTPKAMVEYMASQGVIFSDPNPLMTMEQVSEAAAAGTPQVSTGNEGSVGKKSADAAPSRKRQNSQDVSKGNKST